MKLNNSLYCDQWVIVVWFWLTAILCMSLLIPLWNQVGISIYIPHFLNHTTNHCQTNCWNLVKGVGCCLEIHDNSQLSKIMFWTLHSLGEAIFLMKKHVPLLTKIFKNLQTSFQWLRSLHPIFSTKAIQIAWAMFWPICAIERWSNGRWTGLVQHHQQCASQHPLPLKI